LQPDWFLGAVVARDALVVVLMVLVVRSVLRPAMDPVRAVTGLAVTPPAWWVDDPEWPAAAPTSEHADARLPALSSSAPR
jgi:hypothetical protein